MNNKRLICVAVGVYCCGIANLSSAVPVLDEVVVTAQKTEETIQSVPISIQALDTKMLENNSVNSFSDIKALVPSLRFLPYPTASENLIVSIRGIPGGAVELTQDTPTAVHINGVYIARGNGLNSSVADLERVEVLRGPQGTLYGRNATAGAINLITVKPNDTFSFKQQITVGQRDQQMSKTSINVPITDQLFAKVSYLYDQKEGFIDNAVRNGNDFGDRAAQAARFDVRWEPNADLTIDYSYDWSNSRYYSTPGQCMEVGPTNSLTPAMDPNQCSKSFKDEIAGYGHAPKNTVTNDGHALNVEWEFGDHKTLRSITAYRGINDNYYGVLVAGGANFQSGAIDINLPGVSLPATSDHTKQHQFSQELQLLGDIGEHINYSTGLYYFKESGSENQGYGGVLLARTPAFGVVSTTGPRLLSVTNESMAAFGQLTWTPPILNDNLEIVPGVRITKDKREASMFQRSGGSYLSLGGAPFNVNNTGSSAVTFIGTGDSPAALTGTPAQFDKEFKKFTPSLTLQYHINADLMTYAKYVKGYKSGGTAIRSSNTAAFENGFDPETLESYELGLKSAWLDQRVRANVDVFQSKFTDQQVSVRNVAAAASGATVVPYDIFNAGSSTYEGAELELQVAVTESFRLSANYAYLHFKYDSVEDPSTGADVTRFYHNDVPTNSYSVAADYSLPDVGIGRFDANLSYSYVDRTGNYQDAYSVTAGQAVAGAKTDTRQFITPSYGLWNGRVALSEIKIGQSGKSNMTVALWCKNIADLKYSASTFVTIAQAAEYQQFWGEPRTTGIDVIYKYE